MNGDRQSTRRELIVFLCLTFGLSAVFWGLIIHAGSLGAHGGIYVLALMWSPGVSALATRLSFQRNVRGEGWSWHRETTTIHVQRSVLSDRRLYPKPHLCHRRGPRLARLSRPDALANDDIRQNVRYQWRNLGGVARAAHRVRRLQWRTPSWYSVTCFVLMVVAMGVLLRGGVCDPEASGQQPYFTPRTIFSFRASSTALPSTTTT